MLIRTIAVWVAAVVVVAVGGVRGEEAGSGPAATQGAGGGGGVGEQMKLVEAVRPALVKVEYTLQYDKGEEPRAGAGSRWARSDEETPDWEDSAGANLIQEERPMQAAGFVLSPTQVLTKDQQMHPRFVKSIAVRVGGSDKVVSAKIVTHMLNQRAVVLELAEALPAEVKPLAFDESRPGPYRGITFGENDGEWVVNVHALGGGLTVADSGRKTVGAPGRCLIVDKAGVPVGMTFNGELPAGDGWKGSPLKWPGLSAGDLEKLLAGTTQRAERGILLVTLNFRTNKNADGGNSRYRRRGGDEDESAPVQHALGLLVDEKTVLVLAHLKPNQTARLERVKVQPGEGSAVGAKFSKTLTDYGAFVATLEKPLANPVALADVPAHPLRDEVEAGAQITLQGEKKVSYFQPLRIQGVRVGWRSMKYPTLGSSGDSMFVFDRTGNLLAFPLAQREKASGESRWNADRVSLTNASQIKAVLKELDKNSDPNNVPLTEAEENRLAWLGVELQGLTQELARANNVADQTNDGQMGALVTYVYPDSPAAKAGIEPGYVLLRLYVEGQPKPVDVHVTRDYMWERGFPWDRLDSLPEEAFDEVPAPWPPAETTLTRTLTDLGWGKKFTAEFYQDGKSVKKDFEVTASPTHWGSAAKYKNVPMGLTVKEMTYEVRRYLQKKEDEPGVLISKIEMGSKASQSGLKPFELITEVNGTAVKSIKDFEKATANQEEVRLTIKRMTKGRVVKMKLGGAATSTAPATEPGTMPAEK